MPRRAGLSCVGARAGRPPRPRRFARALPLSTMPATPEPARCTRLRGRGCYAASMAKRKLSPAFKKNAALVKAGKPPLKKSTAAKKKK